MVKLLIIGEVLAKVVKSEINTPVDGSNESLYHVDDDLDSHLAKY